MSFADELIAEVNEFERKANLEVNKFYSTMIKDAPVDTGDFRSAWEINQIGKLKWRVKNNMDYASILWRGRRNVGGKWYGSEQWAQGGEPELKRLEKRLSEL
jgi:hypothetical protein